MIKVAVFCAAGMSTSMLVNKIRTSAKSKGVDIDINAYPESEMSKHTDVNCVLLGPQIKFLQGQAKKIFDPHKVPVEVINTMDYGMMKGENVLNTILKITNK